jgi:hypothetical protein
MCLANCTRIENNGMSYDNVYHSNDYSQIWVNLHAAQDNIYKIEFQITSTDACAVSITENVAENETAIDISGGYKTKNFFKNTTNALVPSSDEEGPVSEATNVPNFSAGLGNDAPAAASSSSASVASSSSSIHYAEAKEIERKLGLIFNAIPQSCRVHLEQYAQFIIYGIVNFMGSFLCYAEFITGEGRADLILRTERTKKQGEEEVKEPSGCIIELKRDAQAVQVAIEQARTQKYVNTFDKPVPVLGISVNGLDKERVTVACQRETLSPKPANISKDNSLLTITPFVPVLREKTKKEEPEEIEEDLRSSESAPKKQKWLYDK